MMRETDRFQAIGDNGKRYTVIERRKVSTYRPLSGIPAEVLGIKDYILSDGRDVNWIDDQTFQILQTDEVIRKV